MLDSSGVWRIAARRARCFGGDIVLATADGLNTSRRSTGSWPSTSTCIVIQTRPTRSGRGLSALQAALHAHLLVLANLVERFFAGITGERIRRGVFKCVTEPKAAIYDYLAKHNAAPKPSVWTKKADVILTKSARAPLP